MYTVKKSICGGYNIYRDGTYVGKAFDEFDPDIKDIANTPCEASEIRWAIMDYDSAERNEQSNNTSDDETFLDLILDLISSVADIITGLFEK